MIAGGPFSRWERRSRAGGLCLLILHRCQNDRCPGSVVKQRSEFMGVDACRLPLSGHAVLMTFGKEPLCTRKLGFDCSQLWMEGE